ncbi:MAG: calcium-binding protein, partial [Gammaproteobacteria bacterium]
RVLFRSWLDAGQIVEQGVTYQRYLHGEAELRVAETIDRSGIGAAGLWLDARGAARALQGGAGNDLYLVDDALDSVSEADGAGVDTVRASISFTLPSDVEILRLGGLTNLDGTGGGGSQQLFGNAGNNRLDGGGGSDALHGGVGNDELVFDAADSLIDGESGLDTLRLDASGVVLDLTQPNGPSLDGIERIDLGAGGNTLVLTVLDVMDLPDAAAAWLNAATRQLLVTGEAGDTVQSLEQGWVRGADQMVGGESYASFTIDGIAAQLLVDLALTRQIT